MGFCTRSIEISGKHFMKTSEILEFSVQNIENFGISDTKYHKF